MPILIFLNSAAPRTTSQEDWGRCCQLGPALLEALKKIRGRNLLGGNYCHPAAVSCHTFALNFRHHVHISSSSSSSSSLKRWIMTIGWYDVQPCHSLLHCWRITQICITILSKRGIMCLTPARSAAGHITVVRRRRMSSQKQKWLHLQIEM